MSNRILIKVADIIGSPLCISAEDGQKVFDKIEPLLKSGKQVTISFERVSMLISLFLNVAIGQLYGSFSEEEVRSLVQVEGLSGDDLDLLKRVVDNAKKYYTNPKGYDTAWEAEGEEDEQ
ncbi:MAG: STAS-like domain-containing protein [Desulfobacterales bacterium]|nr:STAS-like domain-containing protein [Desulfobacterales bacterium]